MQTQHTQQILLATAHREHAKSLYVHAYHKLHDRTLGQDLVQDTFLKTWRYLLRGGKIDVMRAFLYHVLDCLIIDEYRKKKTLSLDQLVESGFDLSDESTEKFLNYLDGKSAMHLIGRLPKKYKQIMEMQYERELSYAEIAHITGQSKNTVTVQAHRGLIKLKELYHMNDKEKNIHGLRYGANALPVDTSEYHNKAN